MVYRELLAHLEELEDDQLELPVMCMVDEEFYKSHDLLIKEKDGNLKDGHPYLIVD